MSDFIRKRSISPAMGKALKALEKVKFPLGVVFLLNKDDPELKNNGFYKDASEIIQLVDTLKINLELARNKYK